MAELPKIDVSTTLPVTWQQGGAKVGNKDLSSEELSAVARQLQADGLIIYVHGDDAGQVVWRLRQALASGDNVTAARLLVEHATTVLPSLGVQPLPITDLSKMGRREGAAAAAYAGATVIERLAPRAIEGVDRSPADLRREGRVAETLWTLRDGFQTLERRVGANELKVLPGLRSDLSTLVKGLGTKTETDPLIRQDIGPAVDFIDGPIQQGQEARRRTEARKDEQQKEIEGKVKSQAREEGREEALAVIKDKLQGAVTPGG